MILAWKTLHFSTKRNYHSSSQRRFGFITIGRFKSLNLWGSPTWFMGIGWSMEWTIGRVDYWTIFWTIFWLTLTPTSFIYPWVTCDSFKSTCASAKRYSLVVTIHLPVASRFPLFNNKGQKSHFSHFPTAHSLKIHFWYSVFFFLRDIWSYQIDSEIRKWFHFVSCHCES